MTGAGGDARAALLDRCVEHLKAGGFGDRSLRQIAAGVGTSHRMLIYHFGSRDGLLAAVVERIEAGQRAALAELAAAQDPVAASAAYWRGLTEAAIAPAERLFFEVYALALHAPDWSAAFRETVVDGWLEPLTDLVAAQGIAPGEAAARARVGLAAVRGLLLDVLLTGDRDGVERAVAALSRMLFTP